MINRRLLWVIAGLVTIITIRTVVFSCCAPKFAVWNEEEPDEERGDSVGGTPDTMRVALGDTLFVTADSIRIRGPHAGARAFTAAGITLLPPP